MSYSLYVSKMSYALYKLESEEHHWFGGISNWSSELRNHCIKIKSKLPSSSRNQFRFFCRGRQRWRERKGDAQNMTKEEKERDVTRVGGGKGKGTICGFPNQQTHLLVSPGEIHHAVFLNSPCNSSQFTIHHLAHSPFTSAQQLRLPLIIIIAANTSWFFGPIIFPAFLAFFTNLTEV